MLFEADLNVSRSGQAEACLLTVKVISTDNSDSMKQTLKHNLLRPCCENWTANNKPDRTADTTWSLDLRQVNVVQSERAQLCALAGPLEDINRVVPKPILILPRLLILAGLPLKDYSVHCALGDLQCSRNVIFAFLRSVTQHNPASEICRQLACLFDMHSQL